MPIFGLKNVKTDLVRIFPKHCQITVKKITLALLIANMGGDHDAVDKTHAIGFESTVRHQCVPEQDT